MTARLPRVILVEDDIAIRQFVSMALEELPLQLIACPTLESARQALELTGDNLALVLLDIMLPDGSGLELLEGPWRQRYGQTVRWAVFSAGISRGTRRLLEESGIDLVLEKPVSLDRLLHGVEAACTHWHQQNRLTSESAFGARPSNHPVMGTPSSPLTSHVDATTEDERKLPSRGMKAYEEDALRQYFFGQRPLFEAMKRQTLARLPSDIATLDELIACGDRSQLHRAAHNMKSMTRMMGKKRSAELAQSLEEAAHRGADSDWPSLWAALRQDLEQWLDEANCGAPQPSLPIP
jgi:DNA-binding response OmpR family regulator/HPt (histidine-containing phosphotransfer) domain-containing protein